MLTQTDNCNTCEHKSKKCDECLVVKVAGSILLSDYEKAQCSDSEFGALSNLINKFVILMHRELQANRYKGSMAGYDIVFWGVELHTHVSKLYLAAQDGNAASVDEHAADCAIIAMKIADLAGEALKTKAGHKPPDNPEALRLRGALEALRSNHGGLSDENYNIVEEALNGSE